MCEDPLDRADCPDRKQSSPLASIASRETFRLHRFETGLLRPAFLCFLSG